MRQDYYIKDAIQDATDFSHQRNASLAEVGDFYLELFTNTALSGNMSVGDKCAVLELINKQLKYFANGDLSYYIDVNLKALESAFEILEQMNQGNPAILNEVTESFSKFKTDVNKKKLGKFNDYLMEIFSITGLSYLSEGTFTVEENMLSKHDLPSLETKRPMNYMGLAIISLVCFPVGLVAIFFASRVKARYNNCNVNGAKRAARYARNIALVGILMFPIVFATDSCTRNSKRGTSSNSQVMTIQKNTSADVKIKDLIGTKLNGYNDERALQDKLGFWSGSRHAYEGGSYVIERWENAKIKEIWLVLLEYPNKKESIIRDILAYKNTTGGDIGPFQVFNNKTQEMSDYMMIQMTSEDKLVKIYDVDSKRKKIIAKDPESHWGEVLSEWDTAWDEGE